MLVAYCETSDLLMNCGELSCDKGTGYDDLMLSCSLDDILILSMLVTD